jgi:hypothetical protein
VLPGPQGAPAKATLRSFKLWVRQDALTYLNAER